MPNQNLHKLDDPLDLGPETVKKGLVGRAGAPVEAATTVDTEAEGEHILGADIAIQAVAALAAVDAVAATTIDVTYTDVAGHTCRLSIFEDAGSGVPGAFVARKDCTDGSESIDVGATGDYVVVARFVRDADGAVGRAVTDLVTVS